MEGRSSAGVGGRCRRNLPNRRAAIRSETRRGRQVFRADAPGPTQPMVEGVITFPAWDWTRPASPARATRRKISAPYAASPSICCHARRPKSAASRANRRTPAGLTATCSTSCEFRCVGPAPGTHASGSNSLRSRNWKLKLRAQLWQPSQFPERAARFPNLPPSLSPKRAP